MDSPVRGGGPGVLTRKMYDKIKRRIVGFKAVYDSFLITCSNITPSKTVERFEDRDKMHKLICKNE